MKKISFYTLALTLVLISCGPAAEDKQQMHLRAKVFQDSIANIIRTSMEEAAAPAPGQVAQPAPNPSQSAAPAQTPTAPAK
jgi:hypothetical protein